MTLQIKNHGPMSHRDTARELARLAERYRRVYRSLLALTLQSGGTVTINGDSFEDIPEGAALDVTTDAETGTTTLRVVTGRVTPDPSDPNTRH